MITHIIYHILGRKVGCTKDMDWRKKLYVKMEGKIPEIEILEELHDKTDKEAGDIEWQWADKLGYKRENHYTHIMRAVSARGKRGGPVAARILQATATFEQRSQWGRKGGIKGARRTHELGLGGYKNLTYEQRVAAARKGGGFQYDICPHCGMISNVANLKNHHFENCRFKNKSLAVLCMCGCEELIMKPGNLFISGHNSRVKRA
jgi:hypothetical protein